MIGQMAIATALCGFNDLGHSMTPQFVFPETDFIYKNGQNLSVRSSKKFKISVHRTSNLAISRLQDA